ncbi:NAD(+)/NADH kinase, partial [Chlamydiia bacterium]|nr:NAD(+)/NADH kinase [Chlamydiia bacterium]
MNNTSVRSIILYFNPQVIDIHQDLITSVVKKLRHGKFRIHSNINLQDTFEISETSLREAEVAVTFGGDGTVLSFFRSYFPITPPIVSVNLGSLG